MLLHSWPVKDSAKSLSDIIVYKHPNESIIANKEVVSQITAEDNKELVIESKTEAVKKDKAKSFLPTSFLNP